LAIYDDRQIGCVSFNPKMRDD